MPLGVVPFGQSRPPAVKPVLLPPGRFHPPSPRRAVLSLANRAAPHLYTIGLGMGAPGLLGLLAIMIAPRLGFSFGRSPAAVVLVELVLIVAGIGLTAAALAQGRQRRADGWRDFGGPSPFLGTGALLAFVSAYGVAYQLLLEGLDIDTESALATMGLVLGYLVFYVGLVALLVVRPRVSSWREIAFPPRLAPDIGDWRTVPPVYSQLSRPVTRTRRLLGDALIALAMVLPLVILSGFVNLTLLLLLGLQSTDIASPVGETRTPLDLLVGLVAVAVVVPIGEETFFRGYATNAWARSLGRNSAILRAGVFFAFIHVINVTNTDAWLALRVGLFDIAARIPVAVALCWLYTTRRSIFASGALHGFYNGLLVLLASSIAWI